MLSIRALIFYKTIHMRLQRQTGHLKRLHQLIYEERTGSPDLLAAKLCVSISQLFNYIEEMKVIGAPIAYDENRKTFYYVIDYEMDFEMVSVSQNITDN